jgi:hypothetical protein
MPERVLRFRINHSFTRNSVAIASGHAFSAGDVVKDWHVRIPKSVHSFCTIFHRTTPGKVSACRCTGRFSYSYTCHGYGYRQRGTWVRTGMTSASSISRAARLWAWLLAGSIFLSVVAVSLIKGRFGQPGPDGDDVMRLVQIRDLLAGQGWFDLHQNRLGPDGGTLMHWSRIPDLPIVVLTGLFDLFLPQDTALAWAISVWPPLSMLFVLGGLWLAARNLDGGRLLVFTFIVALPVLFAHFRFLSGSLDHHNLQLGFLAIAVGASLDRNVAPKSMVLSAIMLALSVAVGIELYPFVAVICGFHALDWAVRGTEIRPGNDCFRRDTGRRGCRLFLCDCPPGALGAGLLRQLFHYQLPRPRDRGRRPGACGGVSLGTQRAHPARGLVGVGLACGVVFVFQGPQCLANPIDVLAPDVREIWFNSITEARPMFAQDGGRWPFIAYAMGTSVVALGVSIHGVIRRRDVRTHSLMFAIAAGARACPDAVSGTRFYVVRQPAGDCSLCCSGREMPSMPVAAGGGGQRSRIAYLAPLVLSNPDALGLAGDR